METNHQAFSLYSVLFQAVVPVALLLLRKNSWTNWQLPGQADCLLRLHRGLMQCSDGSCQTEIRSVQLNYLRMCENLRTTEAVLLFSEGD